MTISRSKSKFGNVRITADGYSFDSLKEHRRFLELRILERGKQIKDLQVHPTFPIIINAVNVCKVEPDFCYYDLTRKVNIYEDVKSPITRKHPVYRLKKKLFLACYGFEITEIN